MTAVLPYAGTSGWSGSEASRLRAEIADSTGITSHRQRTVLVCVTMAGLDGITWYEVAKQTGWHHGAVTGALSVMHKEGLLARLTERRDGSSVYVLPNLVDGRETAQHGRKKPVTLTPGEVVELLADLGVTLTEQAVTNWQASR